MNPAELILTGGIALGIAVPITAAIESGREPADMTRYEFRSNCQVGKVKVDSCVFDRVENKTIGVEPNHTIDIQLPYAQPQ